MIYTLPTGDINFYKIFKKAKITTGSDYCEKNFVKLVTDLLFASGSLKREILLVVFLLPSNS